MIAITPVKENNQPCGLTVSAGINSRETPVGKPLLNKGGSSQEMKYVWNYSSAVGMLSYIQ